MAHLMELAGLHSAYLLCGDLGGAADFYASALGLALLDDRSEPGRRLVFADEPRASGTYLVVTAAERRPGRLGAGALHHTAFVVESTNAQLKWKRWLTDRGIRVLGPYDRGYFRSIYFRDPDRNILEIATRWPGLAEDEDEEELGSHEFIPDEEFTPAGRDEAAIKLQNWPEPLRKIGGDMDLRGLHHVSAICADLESTAAFYTRVLGLRLVKRTRSYDDPTIPHWYFATASEQPGGLVTFFHYPPARMRRARRGLGVPGGFGFAVSDVGDLERWRQRLADLAVPLVEPPEEAGGGAIYFHDPEGILLSISSS